MAIASEATQSLTAEALEAFAAFAETLSFTRGAARLGISQPALFVKVAKLARALDVPLYRRAGRRLVLTAHGEVVARHARAQQEQATALLDELAGGAPHAAVRLASGQGAYLYLLGDGIRRFVRRAAHPLRLLVADGPAAVALVESGRAHLGASTLDAPPDELEVLPLSRIEQVLALPVGHRLATRRSIALADLAGETLIVPPGGRPHREMLARMLAEAGVEWRIGVEAPPEMAVVRQELADELQRAEQALAAEQTESLAD